MESSEYRNKETGFLVFLTTSGLLIFTSSFCHNFPTLLKEMFEQSQKPCSILPIIPLVLKSPCPVTTGLCWQQEQRTAQPHSSSARSMGVAFQLLRNGYAVA